MSNKSSTSLIFNSLQVSLDNLYDGLRSPMTLLTMLDYGLLTHGDIVVRKASLLTLFILIKASMEIRLWISAELTLRAPLLVKDGLIHLSVEWWDAELATFHDSIVATTKLQPGFLGNNLFGYLQKSSNTGLVLGAEALKKEKRLVLVKCLDYLPDPGNCRIFCPATPSWLATMSLEYLPVVDSQVQSLPRSRGRSSSSESCQSLHSLDDDLDKGLMRPKIRVILPRKKSVQFDSESLPVNPLVQKNLWQ